MKDAASINVIALWQPGHLFVVEPLRYRAQRRLDEALFQQLAAGRCLADHRNLLVTGACGVGKSWLSCALA